MTSNKIIFDDFKKSMDIMMNSLKNIDNSLDGEEVKEVNELLKKFDIVLNDEVEEKELITKYETFYDQLDEFVRNKRKEIEEVEDKITFLSELAPNIKFSTILIKKKKNTNIIIDCINRIVERIRELEILIHNKKIKELDNMKVERYDVNFYDFEMSVIDNSINLLKQWSGRNQHQIIFDSKVDGSDDKNFRDCVLRKSSLYFISSDYYGNVFGGFIGERIVQNVNYSCYKIDYPGTFIFSLTRNGIVNNSRYDLKKGENSKFGYGDQKYFNYLYSFGDITVYRIGNISSRCSQTHYEYNGQENVFTDTDKFSARRIVVIQME